MQARGSAFWCSLLALQLLSGADGASADTRQAINLTQSPSSATIVPSTDLNPSAEKAFVVSTVAQFDDIPPVDERTWIIAKVQREKHPFPGWGLALGRFDTSVRLEAYWKDDSGRGGWHTFDELTVAKNRWYCVTLVAKPGETLALFLEERHEGGEWGGAKFLGGFSLSDSGTPTNEVPLTLAGGKPGKPRFRGKIAELFVGKFDDLPRDIENARKFVSGCASQISRRVPTEGQLFFFDGSPQDVTSHKRAIELGDATTWSEYR